MLSSVDVDELRHALGGVVLEAAYLERTLRTAFSALVGSKYAAVVDGRLTAAALLEDCERITRYHTGLTGAAYTDPAQFRSSFGQISWICAAAFACAAVLAAAFITGPGRSAPAPRTALIQTPVPHLACPVAFGQAPGRTRRQDSSPPGDPFRAGDPPSPARPG